MDRRIEICSNDEWVVNHMMGNLGLEVTNKDELSDEWFGNVANRIESLLGGVECVASSGQRATYHGWNGANTFRRKAAGLGTFDRFSDEEWESVWEIAIDEADKIEQRELELYGVED